MKLFLRDYLAMLNESKELEVLVADLLLNMGIEPLSKPQKGVRQHGVDIAAVGADPIDNKRKLFLITIKSGDITRSVWDGKPNAVRPSLDEIKDVYLISRVDRAHQNLPKKIILCCGGELKQEVDENWKGYAKKNCQNGELEYDLWTGDSLALYIEEYFMDEFLFPAENQSLMRKALGLLDQNELEPVFFYRLIDRILEAHSSQNDRNQLKVLRLVNLCVGIVAKWSINVENTRPALLCAEYTLLRTWDFLRKHELLYKEKILEAYAWLYMEYLAVALAYAKRIYPECLIEDGLATFSSQAEVFEYPLRTFEAIGFISALGINHVFCFKETGIDGHKETVHMASQTLAELIKNNPAATAPPYDSHAIELALGLLLLFITGQIDVALAWLEKLTVRISMAYSIGEHFPVTSDSYEDLIALKLGQTTSKQHLMCLSTIIPTIAEWYAIVGRQDDYTAFRKAIINACEDVDFQLWYPDDTTEALLYKQNAAYDTGTICTSINLPESIETLRNNMRVWFKDQTVFPELSCVKSGFPALGLVASRHFRTPVIPAYWQKLLSSIDMTADQSNVQK